MNPRLLTWNNTNVFSHFSEDRKSEIKMLAGPWLFWRLCGRILCSLACSLARSLQPLVDAGSNRLVQSDTDKGSQHLDIASLSGFVFVFEGQQSLDLGLTLIQYAFYVVSITSAKIPIRTKSTFSASQDSGLNMSLGRHNSAHYTAGFTDVCVCFCIFAGFFLLLLLFPSVVYFFNPEFT